MTIDGVLPASIMIDMINNFIEIPYDQAFELPKEELSITPSGRIGITKFFTSKNKIGSQSKNKRKKARLFWGNSSEAVAIAIMFIDDESKSAYPVGFTKQGGAYIVAGKFFKSRGIDPKQYAGKYNYKAVSADSFGLPDKGTVFILEIKKAPRKSK